MKRSMAGWQACCTCFSCHPYIRLLLSPDLARVMGMVASLIKGCIAPIPSSLTRLTGPKQHLNPIVEHQADESERHLTKQPVIESFVVTPQGGDSGGAGRGGAES